MTKKYTPGSFTKNFSWSESYERLHAAIRAGFSLGSTPIVRAQTIAKQNEMK
jgi:hypothetical protein